jgi:DNA helicase HerA-like ATPase
LGGCIATQRIAYLNTNALQQLHTYFVGTLPRPYDRNLVSNTFTIDQGILLKEQIVYSPVVLVLAVVLKQVCNY